MPLELNQNEYKSYVVTAAIFVSVSACMIYNIMNSPIVLPGEKNRGNKIKNWFFDLFQSREAIRYHENNMLETKDENSINKSMKWEGGNKQRREFREQLGRPLTPL